jgi:hypothetical protein
MTDYLAQTYQKLWELLSGHAPLTEAIKAGNWIRLNNDTALIPYKTASSDADFPELLLAVAEGNDSFLADDGSQVYGYDENTATATMAWTEDWSQTYIVRLIMPDFRLARATRLILEAGVALRKAGPKLGLAWVEKWGPARWAFKEDMVHGTLRLIVTVSIPVQMRFHGQAMLS